MRPPLAHPDRPSDALAEVIPFAARRQLHPAIGAGEVPTCDDERQGTADAGSGAEAGSGSGPAGITSGTGDDAPEAAPSGPPAAGAGAGAGPHHAHGSGSVDEVARALRVLRHRAGERGLELPADLGRVLADIEMLLVEGPTGIDPVRALPALAAELATMVADAARATLELVPGEAAVLGEALAADLCDLRLDRLQQIADAVLAVSRAPRAAEHWGEPRAAEAAEAVITAAANDLREAAVTHEWLYEHFTDRVWTIPTPLLERGQRRWRVAARARLSAQLRRASRRGRLPGRLGGAAAGVLLARRARSRVDAVGPLLSQHLGVLHRGPLSDADAALRAVQAVRQLQSALGDLADGQRLRRLILADAFRSEDVFGPAVNLRMGLGAWQRDVEGAGGKDPLAYTLLELADWSDWVLDVLPSLREASEAAAEIGVAVGGLRDLVQLYLLRQHVAEVTVAHTGDVPSVAHVAGATAASTARTALADALTALPAPQRERLLVRINSEATPWFAADLQALAQLTAQGLAGAVVPKAERAQTLQAVARAAGPQAAQGLFQGARTAHFDDPVDSLGIGLANGSAPFGMQSIVGCPLGSQGPGPFHFLR